MNFFVSYTLFCDGDRGGVAVVVLMIVVTLVSSSLLSLLSLNLAFYLSYCAMARLGFRPAFRSIQSEAAVCQRGLLCV